MDAALLPGADADGLAVLRVADAVRLRILERDEGEQQVVHGALRELFVRRDDVLQALAGDGQGVVALLEADAEDVAPLDGRRLIVGVDAHDVVVALALGAQYLDGLRRVAGGDDAVGHFGDEQPGRLGVADVAQRGPVAVGAQAVGPARAGVGRGDGREVALGEEGTPVLVGEGARDRRAGRRDVLEAGRGALARGALERADELPGVERVHEVDIAGPAVHDLHRQLAAVGHVDARRLLIGIAAVFELYLLHFAASSYLLIITSSPSTQT